MAYKKGDPFGSPQVGCNCECPLWKGAMLEESALVEGAGCETDRGAWPGMLTVRYDYNCIASLKLHCIP